jgi:cation-transporting ATPase E
MIESAPISVVSCQPLGLTEAEAQRRCAQRGTIRNAPTSRSYRSIILANVFTVFNLILLLLGAVALTLGDPRDALFLGVLLSNSIIGITQEVRAKRTLDRLGALIAPTGTVMRDGRLRKISVPEIVQGDLLMVEAGDGIVADGLLEASSDLHLDESILTGESLPVARSAGEEVRSGSFVVEGAGSYRVSAVGPESYAARLMGDARRFRHPRSPLERALNRLLLVLLCAMIPMGAILGYALWERKAFLSEAVTTSLAGILPLLPEGLIVLMSITYAVAAVRLGRHGALVQQLNAIESLASVDVVCFDKTGTLTDPTLHLVDVIPVAGLEREVLTSGLGRYAASSPSHNATLQAIAEGLPMPAEPVQEHLPFASRRRFSALQLKGITYVLGAPKIFQLGVLAEAATQEATQGRRVVAFGTAIERPEELAKSAGQPRTLSFLGLVVLAEKLRPETRATVAFLLSQSVTLKVLSGDATETVASIAADAGIPITGGSHDGSALPREPEALREFARRANVIGRITPQEKRRFIEALQKDGSYVAMIGDGVNDVPALKAARLAIAQGTGSQIARSVADIVLVHGDFAVFPRLVSEGRSLLRNLMLVSKLFVSKAAFAVFLILLVGITPTSYTFLPRHLSLLSSLTVGLPALFLALRRSEGPWRTGPYLRDVARFAVPAGTAEGLAVVSSYLFALHVLNMPLIQARTVATTAFIIVGLYLVLVLEAGRSAHPLSTGILCLSLAGLYVLVLVYPASRNFFTLDVPHVSTVFTAAAGSAVALTGLWLTDEQFHFCPLKAHRTRKSH